MKEITKKEADEARVVVEHLGNLYRSYRKEMDIFEFQNCVQENYSTYKADADFVYLVDRNLQDCSKDTKCIITHDYLKKSEPNWFLNYYSRSTYYRLKRLALKEFVDCLNS